MLASILVLLIGAVLTAAAAFWVLRAYRRGGGGEKDARPALGAAVLVSLIALGVYVAVGRPELPGAPYRERMNNLIAALRSPTPPPITPDEQLAVWMHLSREQPQAFTPHLEAAKALLAWDRPREAVIQFDRALQIEPNSAEALLGMGRALVALEGRVSPDSLSYFARAGESSDDPAPWLYQAMAAMEENRQDDVRRFWREAEQRMAPDDPRRAMAAQFANGQAAREQR